MSNISKTAAKALLILDVLAKNGEMTPQELASAAEVNRTVVQRLLATLLLRNYVERTPAGYAPSSRLWVLGESVEQQLRCAAEHPLKDMASEVTETIVLQVDDGNDAVVIQEILPDQATGVIVRHALGSRTPLWQTASGRAILAHLNRSVQDRIALQAPDAEYLREEIPLIVKNGYAKTAGRLQTDVTGYAVPIFGDKKEVVGSIAALAPTSRAKSAEVIVPLLREAAQSTANNLG